MAGLTRDLHPAMPPTLGPGKCSELEDALAVMLAPLDWPTVDDWLAAVNRSVLRFFEADGTLSVYAAPGRDPVTVFHNVDAPLARALQDALVGPQGSTLQLRYPLVSRVMRRLAGAGVTVWTPELAERVTRIASKDLPFVREVLAPGGILHHANLAIPLPDGAAQLSFFHIDPNRDPFGEERVSLLELLRPAFQAGVDTLGRIERQRATLEAVLEGDRDPVLIVDPDGVPVHRNAAAVALFSEDRWLALLAEGRAVAAEVRSLRARPRKAGPAPPRLVRPRVRTAGRVAFRVSATFLPGGLFHGDWAVLVRFERLDARLPDGAEIERRFGLTPRQAEVARLIASDLDSREIARRLGISVHTVRRHAEQVLAGLGVRSRKGVSGRLLGAPLSRRGGIRD